MLSGVGFRAFAAGTAVQLLTLTVSAGQTLPAGASRGVLGQPPASLQRFHQTHSAMGTEFSIDIYARDERTAEAEANVAFDEVDRLEDLLSNYKPASELSRISREAGIGPVTTDPETFRFLERSFYWSDQSAGAFDITVGPLLKVWGFYEHGGRVPTDTELRGLRENVGWDKVHLGAADRSVAFMTHRAMDLDPGSIGKGFAVESAEKLLREAGVKSALISAGGSTLYGIGAPPGEAGWPVKVDDPRSPGVVATTVYLKDMSLSSGACTQKFFIKDGHRYCHIFNPQTMRPVEGVLQTTVISPSATDGDALSTVVFVLPPSASRRVLDMRPDDEALIFLGSGSYQAPGAPGECVAINWPGRPCEAHASFEKKETQP